jgi:hypothetical protein
MRYLKLWGVFESSSIKSELESITRDVRDILVEFIDYDISIVTSESDVFHLRVVPKMVGVEPILMTSDVLGDLQSVISLINVELSYTYSHSYFILPSEINWSNYSPDKFWWTYKGRRSGGRWLPSSGGISGDLFKSLGKEVSCMYLYFNKV